MAMPVKEAYCNRADGRAWSLWYSVLPETGEMYWVQFLYASKAKGKSVSWSVTECSIMDRSKLEASDRTHRFQLDKAGAIASAKEWYANDGPYAGQYTMVTPVLAAYRNKADGSVWSIKYNTRPDAGGEVFVKFQYEPVKQKNGSVKWTVIGMGEQDPSAKEVRAAATDKPLRRKRATPDAVTAAAGEAAGRKRRQSGFDVSLKNRVQSRPRRLMKSTRTIPQASPLRPHTCHSKTRPRVRLQPSWLST